MKKKRKCECEKKSKCLENHTDMFCYWNVIVNSYTWTHQVWPTSKELYTSALKGCLMQSRRPARSR